MVHNIADVTPAATTKALSLTRIAANWVMLSAPTGNAADIRVGDSAASATSGVTLKAGTTLVFPPIGDAHYLDLAKIFVYGTTTDKVGVVYGTS